jgi:hypothetical protein
MSNLSILDRVRNWIDGDSNERVLEQAAEDAQVKPRSKAESFIVKIAKEVEAVMQAEMVPLPQGTIIIPTEYTIFLSAEDDKNWKGIKRRGLEQGLHHILAERARELAGKKPLETKSLILELRLDATLGEGEIRVQHSWEDSSGSKTGVLARPKPAEAQPPAAKDVVKSTAPVVPNPYAAPQREVNQATQLPVEEVEEMTAVVSRSPELYKLEIYRDSVRQTVLPVFKDEIVIGRGSKSQPVDVPLTGDPEISRRHLSITRDAEGKFWAVNNGKNPASMNESDLPSGERVSVTAGVPIQVCSYVIRIQPA